MTSDNQPITRGPSPNGRVADQHKLILKYLGAGRKLSNMEALNVLGVSSLTKRISELRRLGHPIDGEWKRDAFNVRYKVYFLKAAEKQD